MEIRKLENGMEFVNEWKDRGYYGFAHESTLFSKNGAVLGKARVNYINRTWEYYRYQTSMRRCIDNIIEEKQERYITNYKYENNIKRLMAKVKEQILLNFEELAEIKELRKCYEELEYRV